MIGRFIVIDQLGAGAGGVVVSAYDPDLDRKVALKVLRPEHVYTGSVGRARERLLREAKAVARVSHPNIITVHEVGSVEDQVFVAMEYVDGGTLRDTLSLRRRDWRQVLDLLLPAARGLAAAHASNMVHRDFKPANVLVSQASRVVVTDFGLVSTTQDPDNGEGDSHAATAPRDPSLTDTGTTLGTPAYMAPEQHRGADVDARSDQFAFCVTLFEALYGERPFGGNTLLDLMKAKESGDVSAVVRTGGSDVPSWLRQLVLRGLSADPSARYANMAELIGELESHRADRPRRGWIGLAALALVVPAAVIGYRSLTKSEPAPPSPEIASLKAELAKRDDELSRTRAELKRARTLPKVDPADLAALEVRIAELQGDLDQLDSELAKRAPVATATPERKRPGIKEADRFEMPSRRRTGPTLPATPEPHIVASVFSGLQPAIERCAGIPDLGRERTFEDWQRLMDKPIDTDVSVKLTIEPDGRASKVRVGAHRAGVRTCIALAVRRARFPVSIEGGPASYSYSLFD